jgi:hypothetical protein
MAARKVPFRSRVSSLDEQPDRRVAGPQRAAGPEGAGPDGRPTDVATGVPSSISPEEQIFLRYIPRDRERPDPAGAGGRAAREMHRPRAKHWAG